MDLHANLLCSLAPYHASGKLNEAKQRGGENSGVGGGWSERMSCRERAPLVTTSDFACPLALTPSSSLPPPLLTWHQTDKRGSYLGSGNSKPALVFVYPLSLPSIPAPSNVSAFKNQNWSWKRSWIGECLASQSLLIESLSAVIGPATSESLPGMRYIRLVNPWLRTMVSIQS